MRRFLPLIAIGALVMGGCAFTDQQAALGPIRDMNQTHGVITCDENKRVGNTQQLTEPNAKANLHYACCGTGCVPPTGSSFTCVDSGVTLRTKDTKNWVRFVADWADYQSRLAVYNCAGYMDPGCGTWAASSQKKNADGSFQFNTYWRPLGYLNGVTTWDGMWDCAIRGDGGKPTYYANGEASMAGDGLYMAAQKAIPEQAQSWLDFQVESVAIDTAPGLQWGGNIVASTPGRVVYGYSAFTGWNYAYNMGGVTDTPIKPTAGLADFFAGEPLTVSYKGYDITAQADLFDDGSMNLSLLRIEHDGSVFEPSQPIVFETHRDTPRALALNKELYQEQIIEWGEWTLENVPMDQTIELGGFIPELGINQPPVSVYFVSESLRNYLARASSNIQPRERGRLR
jgi:hypothetical protein